MTPGGSPRSGAARTDPAAVSARLQLDGAIAAVPVSIQDELQISHKKMSHTGVPRKLLLQSQVVRFGSEFAFFKKLQSVPLTVEEVTTWLERLHRM